MQVREAAPSGRAVEHRFYLVTTLAMLLARGNRLLPQLLPAAALSRMALAERAVLLRPRPALRRLVRLPGRAGGPRQRGTDAASSHAGGTVRGSPRRWWRRARMRRWSRRTGRPGSRAFPCRRCSSWRCRPSTSCCFPRSWRSQSSKRRDAQAHKRLMLLATVNLLAAAFARWPVGTRDRQSLPLLRSRRPVHRRDGDS